MTGTTIAQAIPIAISPILSRIYSPEDFGLLALFIAIVAIFISISTGRYELAILLPEEDEDAINILALGLIITSVISMLLLLLILLCSTYIASFLNIYDLKNILYLIPITVFLTGLFNLLIYFNNRKERYKDIAKVSIIKSVVLSSVQLSLGFIQSGANGLILGQVFSSLFANIVLLKKLIQQKYLITLVTKNKLVEVGKKYKRFPLLQAPHALLNTFSSNIPVYIFTVFFNTSIVGLYALSTRIIFMPMVILSGATAKVYNKNATKLYNEKADTYGFTLRLLKSIFKKIIIPFVLIIIFAPEIFTFVFGQAWAEAGIYTQILSPWLFMVFFMGTISFIPNLVQLQRKALIVEIIYTILRVMTMGIGVYFNNVYLALIGFSFVGFFILMYNMFWMLNALKRDV